jgi:hypothetical protein
LIMDYFLSSGSTQLTPAKAFFGDEMSYSELRVVAQYLSSTKKQTEVGENRMD